MDGREHDRRRNPDPVRTQPRPSPANVLVLTVIGVLGIVAVATAFLGTGQDDATPHGQVLGDLQRLGDAQAKHFEEHGAFAGWVHTLEVRSHPQVRVTILRADDTGWEAVASHEIGLTCARGGSVAANGRAVLEPPICYAPGP